MNETNFKLTPDDPKLTAYALGELEGAERAAAESAIRENPALGAVVEEIRAMAAQMKTALAAEPAPKIAAGAVRDANADEKDGGERGQVDRATAADPYARKKSAKVLRFPQVYFLVGGLAAAGFAVLVAVKTPRPTPPAEVKHYVEIPLAPVEKPVDENPPAETEAVAAAAPSLPAPSANADAAAKVALPTFDAKADGLLAQAKREMARRTEESVAGVLAANQAIAAGATLQQQMRAPSQTFGANGETTSGYIAGNTLAGTRVRTNLSDASGASKSWGGVYASGTGALRMNLAVTARGLPSTANEAYTYRRDSDFLTAAENPLSTFSADVDTASYANVRRMLNDGVRPPADAVRIEELLNYFPFAYAGPAAAPKRGEGTPPTSAEAAPFAATMEVADAPWATNHKLVRIGLKGREVTTAERGAANLVFLLDVSGSMNSPNKLPLVKESMHLLLSKLRPDDRVAIVVYAGASGLALPSTPVKHARAIADAIDELQASGSTNGALGIQLAYDIAKANFIEGGINRVVLCTDGDFNVGTTSEGELVRLITEKAKSKVFLTALGFGMGNYKDATLQQIADAGNGNYGYVDTRREAEKLLVEQVNGTLVTIAKDVKLQVEFNPAKVASYRLIGYEKRLLKKEDFNNDKVDAGEIGAGHAVTALYEIVPVGAKQAAEGDGKSGAVDELRYVGFASAPMAMKTNKRSEVPAGARAELADELLTLKVRYKEPAGEASKRLEFPLADRNVAFAAASADFKFAAAVAGFGMVLRDSPNKGATTLDDVKSWAEAGIGNDPGGYRAEFVGLVKKARALE